jgi:DNA primase
MTRFYDPNALGLEFTRLSGTEAYCICPFHNDHSPSASFNVVTGLFHCFACGENANVIRLQRELGGDIVYTDKIVAPRRKDAEDWEWILTAKLALDNPYLESRQVPNELVKRFGIREVKGGVAFIIHDVSGRAIGAQVRRLSNKPRYMFYGERGETWPISTLFESRSCDTIVITEGIFGTLRGTLAGRKAVASMGSSAINGVARLLNGRSKLVFFDNDLAGHIGAAKLVSLGAKAIVPGGEADETSIDDWINLERNFKITDDPYEIANLSADPQRVVRLIAGRKAKKGAQMF